MFVALLMILKEIKVEKSQTQVSDKQERSHKEIIYSDMDIFCTNDSYDKT